MGESLKRKRAKAHTVRCERQSEVFLAPTLFYGHIEECGQFYTCQPFCENLELRIGQSLWLHIDSNGFVVLDGNEAVANICDQDIAGLRERFGQVFIPGKIFPLLVREECGFGGYFAVSLPPAPPPCNESGAAP